MSMRLWLIKKNGILVIDNDRNDTHQHRGYPVKLTYKYPGIKLDSQLSLLTGLEEVKKKLDIYLSRNNWINKFTMTPKSLINLSTYYQRSRMVYGMSCFLDMRKIIDSVERGNLRTLNQFWG